MRAGWREKGVQRVTARQTSQHVCQTTNLLPRKDSQCRVRCRAMPRRVHVSTRVAARLLLPHAARCRVVLPPPAFLSPRPVVAAAAPCHVCYSCSRATGPLDPEGQWSKGGNSGGREGWESPATRMLPVAQAWRHAQMPPRSARHTAKAVRGACGSKQ